MGRLAAVAFALVLGVQAGVAVAAPAAAVSPSSGLTHGQTVTVSVSGFASNALVYVSECAEPSAGHVVCDIPGIEQISTDGGGSGSTTLTALRTFTAYSEPGVPWGTVDCGTVPGGCFVAVATETSPMIRAAISFG